MENRANYLLVGLFTLIIVAASFGFVYWSSNVGDANRRTALIVRIQGAVTGLSAGSQVLFNGLNVGAVTSLRIDPNDPRTVIATTQVDRDTPITTSTQASIGFQGLTGVGFIGLSGGDAADRSIIASALEQGATPVIQATPSDVTDILATARDISDRANNILGEFERIVLEVGPAVTTTAENIARTSGNVDIFTASLAANADQIEDFVGSLGRLATSANDVALQLPTFIDQVADFVGALNSESINQSIENVAAITGSVREQTPAIASAIESVSAAAEGFGVVGETVSRNSAQIDQFLAALGPLSETVGGVATRLDGTLQSAQGILDAVDANEVGQAVSDVAAVTAAVREQTPNLVSTIESVTSVIASFNTVGDTVEANLQALDQFLASLGPLSQTTQSVATRLDSTLESVQNIADSIDTVDIDRAIDNVTAITQTFVDQNETISRAVGAIADSAESFGAFGQAIQTNIAGIGQFLGALGPIGERAPSIASNLDETLISARQVAASVDPENVRTTVESVTGFTSALNERAPQVQEFISGANIVLTSLQQSLAGLDETRGLVDQILAGIEPELVNRAVTDVSAASTNIASAAEEVGNVARDIGARREDIDSFITNAQVTSENLRVASARADEVIASVDEFLNGPESDGLTSQARETLLAIQQAANSVRAGIDPISASVTNLSDQSLREVQGLARSTTESISRVERAITDLANNPSRVITGGGGTGGVREFDGRARR